MGCEGLYSMYAPLGKKKKSVKRFSFLVKWEYNNYNIQDIFVPL